MKLGMIRFPNEDGFRYLAKKELEFMEVCCNSDDDSRYFIEHKDEIKGYIDQYKVPVQSVGRWNAAPIREGKLSCEVVDLQKNLMAAVAEVGSPVFVCGCAYDGSVSLYKNYCLAVDYFGTLVEEAKKYNGMKVAVYNCDWGNFVCTDEQWKIVLGEIPELMLKYDCSHSFSRNQDYIAELNTWMSRVAHMHIKGVSKVNDDAVDNPPAGMDSIDWPTVFSLIYRYGYDAGLSIEPHSSIWQGALGEAGIDYTIKYMKPMILR